MEDTTTSEETSRYEVLSKLLTDENFSDISLKGDDGVLVRANRCVLAARSEVFYCMFFKDFQESSSQEVELGFPGSVLQAVVEYIHTDSATVVQQCRKPTQHQVSADGHAGLPYTLEKLRILISVAEASAYFDLPGLEKEVFATFENHIWNRFPEMSFAILEVCAGAGATVPPKLMDAAVDRARSTALTKSLTTYHVGCLSVPVLTKLLKDPAIQLTELELFTLLNMWVEADDTRVEIGLRLSQHICFARINPTILSSTICKSGLATKEQLQEARRSQEEVKGAGIEEVNGVYKRSGKFGGLPHYTKSGPDDNVYSLFKCKTRVGHYLWFLSICDEDHPGTDGDIDFYCSHVADTDIPPSDSTSWKCSSSGRGAHPLPTLIRHDISRPESLFHRDEHVAEVDD